MHKFFKKSIAVLLVAIMTLSIAPLAGLLIIANAETVTGTCGAETGGANLTWSFDDSTGILTITGSGQMANYTKAAATPWYGNKTNKIKSVSIGSGVTSIGNYAFATCASLESVSFAQSSELETVGSWAFFGCSKLASIELPEGVTAFGSSSFAGTGITSFAVPEGVTVLPPAVFENCASLKSVTFAQGIALKEVGSWVFNNCSALETVVIPDGVRDVGSYVFANCSSLTSVTFPKDIRALGSNTFTGCSSLTAVELPASTETIGDEYFANCSSLESITIPANVTAIGEDAFINCTSLTSVTFAPASALTTIGARAFYNCGKLASFAVPASVTSIGQKTVTEGEAEVDYDYYRVFDFCLSLESFSVDAANAAYSSDDAGVLYNKAKTVIIKYPAASAGQTYTVAADVTEIKDFAFESCKNLEQIIVDADNANYSSDATGILYNKDKTTVIQYPAGNPAANCVLFDGVRTISTRAFSDCANLTQFIHVPTTVTTAGFEPDCFVNVPASCYFCNDERNFEIIAYISDTLKRTFFTCSRHNVCTHRFVEDMDARKESTCSETGEKRSECSICGEPKIETIPTKSHTYGATPVIVEPTSCKSDGSGNGTSTLICLVCNEERSKIVTPLVKAHTFSVVTKPAECGIAGETVKTCSECGEVVTETITALAHVFGPWDVTVDRDGQKVDSNNAPGVAGSRRHTCTVCGETVVEALPALPVITIDDTEVTTAVYKGEALNLSCTVENLSNYMIVWECSDPEKATIRVNATDATKCTVTAISHGDITITARVLTRSSTAIKDGKDEDVDVHASIDCKAQMTFWQRIVAFFRNIFDKLSLESLIGSLVG